MRNENNICFIVWKNKVDSEDILGYVINIIKKGALLVVDKIILSAVEWIGTVSFAASGALVAIGCSLDLFGVVTVGCITAVGGGIVRDVLIGNIPPKVFSNPLILVVAALTTILVFVVSYFYRKKFNKIREKAEMINVLFDALGLAAFSIAGIEVAALASYKGNPLLTITLGVITGVGGGIFRDLLVNQKPYILVKHVYAVVSIAACCLYYLISIKFGNQVFATVFVIAFTVLVRFLAAKFRWELPKIDIK